MLTLGAFGTDGGPLTRQSVGEEQNAQPGNEAEQKSPWGDPVDGLACRLVMQPRYVVGQAISAPPFQAERSPRDDLYRNKKPYCEE